MEFESAQSNTTAKLPILKLAQENGTSVTKMLVPVTAEENTNKKNDKNDVKLMLATHGLFPMNINILSVAPEDNGEPESYSEALSSKESVQWKKAINEEMVSLEKNQTWSLVRLPAGKKALQSKWVFRVKEEQDGSKRYKARLVVKGFQQKRREPSYVGALNDTSTQHKSKGFQLAGQEENLECRLKEILYGLIQAPRLWLRHGRVQQAYVVVSLSVRDEG
ncbi:retrovirus-related pol polyprotein from transposon TNT 1-94 [Tanacetum coccineum]